MLKVPREEKFNNAEYIPQHSATFQIEKKKRGQKGEAALFGNVDSWPFDI